MEYSIMHNSAVIGVARQLVGKDGIEYFDGNWSKFDSFDDIAMVTGGEPIRLEGNTFNRQLEEIRSGDQAGQIAYEHYCTLSQFTSRPWHDLPSKSKAAWRKAAVAARAYSPPPAVDPAPPAG